MTDGEISTEFIDFARDPDNLVANLRAFSGLIKEGAFKIGLRADGQLNLPEDGQRIFFAAQERYLDICNSMSHLKFTDRRKK